MFSPLLVIGFVLGLGAILFVIALTTERQHARGNKWASNAIVYSLALAIYCTSWTFYGSVGKAASSGWSFLPVYLGPTLAIILWWSLIRKMVRLKTTYHISNIADFIATRYDRSTGVAAIASLIALVGVIPYIGLQLRAILATFSLMTQGSALANPWLENVIGLGFVALMIVFTIVFGVRRLDPTERHPGIVMVLAVMSILKLAAFLAAGAFVTFGLFHGFNDILGRLASSETYSTLLSLTGGKTADYLNWMTILILSMSAIMFLPRQFHVTVVENADEGHLRTAMWLFPLYLLAINVFVVPIAAGGLLTGATVEPDYFVLALALDHGPAWLSLFIYLGGFVAAVGMIIVSAMTLSTMFTNNIVQPVIRRAPGMAWLQRSLLQLRWAAVGLILLLAYLFERQAGTGYPLVSIGMISFAAVMQLAPAMLGGLFWREGSRVGANLGLGAGFVLWFYTLLLPTFVDPNSALLVKGPLGIAFLRPEHLFGLAGMSSLSQGVFWSILFNVGLYVLGSLASSRSQTEREMADEFIGVLTASMEQLHARHGEATIDLNQKMTGVAQVLLQYFSSGQAVDLLNDSLRAAGVQGQEKLSIMQLVEVYGEVERRLAGSIGAANAHNVMRSQQLLSDEEAQVLTQAYSEILADLQISPEELRERVDYYQERATLLANQAEELETRVQERTRELEKARQDLEASNEELIVATREAQEASRLKDEFLSVMSHELRTPLNAILGYQGILELMGGLQGEDLEMVQRTQTNARRLLNLINDVLDISRIEAGRLELVPEELTVTTLVNDICAQMEVLAAEKRLAFNVAIDDAVPPTVYMDEDALSKILVNLLGNAFKFTQEGAVGLNVGANDGHLVIAVSDTGPGIPVYKQEIIFERFRQADSSSTREHGGSGLGLSIVQQLCQVMGGQVTVNSDVGRGSIFTVTLPLQSMTEPQRVAV